MFSVYFDTKITFLLKYVEKIVKNASKNAHMSISTHMGVD